MPDYEINWAIGGRKVITAASAEDASAYAEEILPWGNRDWKDIDVIPVQKDSDIALG